jgi:hypothetical protein
MIVMLPIFTQVIRHCKEKQCGSEGKENRKVINHDLGCMWKPGHPDNVL